MYRNNRAMNDESKQRFRLYKSGKHWITQRIAVFAVFGTIATGATVLSQTNEVHADTLPSTSQQSSGATSSSATATQSTSSQDNSSASSSSSQSSSSSNVTITSNSSQLNTTTVDRTTISV